MDRIVELKRKEKLTPYYGLTKTVVVMTYELSGGGSAWFKSLFKDCQHV